MDNQTKDILKALRKSKGFANAKDFCDAVGISFNTYQNYETGKRVPTTEMLVKLADFYGVTTDYLLGREPQNNPLTAMGIDLDHIDEERFMKAFRALPEVAKIIIVDAMRRLSEAAASGEPSMTVSRTLGDLKDAREQAAAEQEGGKFA